jgi:hypothetical protein
VIQDERANVSKKKAGQVESGGINVTGTVGSVGGDIVGRDKIVIHAPATKVLEKDIVYRLLVFLEDRRLLTEEFGYQSHFPDHLRMSAEEIRRRTNEAIQSLDSDSPLVPVLKRLQDAARKFQAATEGAMDGHRAGGGLTPMLPMPFANYVKSLLDYRQEIAAAIVEAAGKYRLNIDPRIVAAASPHSEEAAWVRSVTERDA